jgi:putative membrane-bound dehydrogenase-like protein
MFRPLLLLLAVVPMAGAASVPLFDGKSLAGWEIRKGEEAWWRVEDGMIVGGSLTEMVPFNTFLTTRASYRDFELTYKIRMVKGDGFINSGMQIRSQRLPDQSEMIGYQVDAGIGYWGDLYDESRRNTAIAKAPAIQAHDWDWNEYRVRCEGPRVRTWINGVAAIDYTESDATISHEGKLGLQAHGGGKFLVQLKDISITEIATNNGARSPKAQRAGFKLPDDYTVDLVSSEEQGTGKPITVAWDRHGRMWTTTALEYPVDANENEAIARELYRSGGNDRVLVFDEPNAPGPLVPRVFAEGLAIPLGVLPLRDSVLVQHGPEIRRYRDTDGDGKADQHDVVLEGFGIQDSHLFPHQFERANGGWLYLAQGAFNYSKVQRPGGVTFADGSTSVDFNNCKLARFRADGSEFESLTGGPNNIWGLTFARNGETFVQEANDLGYPVAEFEPGTHYPTGFGPRLRDDAPILPASTPNQPMGGTGLSGLALAADANTPFAKNQGAGEVFYVANPITSKIQVVTMTRNAAGHPVYQKGSDFLTSDDPWFRPISIQFGPDGCLYVVDWYNKIISHNEVPRVHPDRDKIHGRIWRIRHQSQSAMPRVDLATLADPQLVDLLGGSNARIARQAWQEIIDRKATGLTSQLVTLLTARTTPLPKRCDALWALEGLQATPASLLAELAASADTELRYEAVRIAGESSLPTAEFVAVIAALGDETHFRVRAAIANAVRAHRKPTPAIVTCAARLGLAPMDGPSRPAYDRNFERYLARWAMAEHAPATHAMLGTTELTAEARLLAARALEPATGAALMVEILPDLQRPLAADELALLGQQLQQPAVLSGFNTVLQNPDHREAVLRTMTQLDPQVAAIPELAVAVGDATRQLLASERNAAREKLAVQLARRFRLKDLAGDVEAWMNAPQRTPAELAEGLATLRETGVVNVAAFRKHLDATDEVVRREAISGFGNMDDVTVVAELSKRWASLSGALRSLAVAGMTSSEAKAEAFARAISDGQFQGFDGAAVEKLIAALGTQNAAVAAVLEATQGLLKPVIVLDGKPSGRMVTQTTLRGPFTLETWIKLDPGIGNQDAIFGRRGGPDFNFYQSRLRVFGGPAAGDLIIAKREIKENTWTHCAITRDAEGRLTLYLDGEPDSAEGRTFTDDFTDLNLGETHSGGSTGASFDEVRIWDIACSAEEIRRDAHTALEGPPAAGLKLRITGSEPEKGLEGTARSSLTMDFPQLVTPADAQALEEKFAKYRLLASQPGDATRGRQLAQTSCMICHQIQGEGTLIGPNLSGAGAMGTEALLRNLLTPNAQLESGYYRHDLKLRDGSVVSGFLVDESASALTLRQIGADERVIPQAEILSHEISRRSLMPEGLIDGFTPQQVSDLFSYLHSLR